MIVSRAFLLLFNSFPREILDGIDDFAKRRILVRNLRELMRKVDYLNGKTDVFISVYKFPESQQYVIVDKLFFDIDGDLNATFDVVRQIHEFVREKRWSGIPIFSGRKGFHYYILLQPKVYPVDYAKKAIRYAQFRILDEAGLLTKTSHGEYLAPQIDTHVLGDVKRLTRLPNTIHPKSHKYCIPLPQNFHELSLLDILELSKMPQDFNYTILSRPFLDELVSVDVSTAYTDYDKLNRLNLNSTSLPKTREQTIKYLSNLLRPCELYPLIEDKEPPHWARVSATITLLLLGYKPEEIAYLYSKLGWIDFDWDVTMYQINHILTNRYKPYSCKRLMQLSDAKYCYICFVNQ